MRTINEIIFHCADTYAYMDIGKKEIDSWHRARGWNGIGYHYVIRRDGTIEQGRPEEQVGAHVAGHNANSIGICYAGGKGNHGWPEDNRTPAQRNSMINLVNELLEKYPEATVVGQILIDNGHGIETHGKRSPVWQPDELQLFEYEFNRDIANRVFRILKKENVDCELLTPQIQDVTLSERVRRANAWHEKTNCLLISIHANAGGGTGWEVYTSPGKTKSDRYAEIMFNEAKMWLPDFRMRTDYSDGDPDKEAMFYMLTKTDCPAILTENLFMDNETDCRFLLSEEGREIISYIHVNGVLKILKSES